MPDSQPQNPTLNQLLARGYGTVDEALAACFGEWPPKGLDIIGSNDQRIRFIHPTTEMPGMQHLTPEQKQLEQTGVGGRATVVGERVVGINSTADGKALIDPLLIGHELTHILQGDNSYRQRDIYDDQGIRWRTNSWGEWKLPGHRGFSSASRMYDGVAQNTPVSDYIAHDLFTTHPSKGRSLYERQMDGKGAHVDLSDINIFYDDIGKDAKTRADNYVSYLQKGKEIQSRLHEIIIKGYQTWGRMPQNVSELHAGLISAGLRAPDKYDISLFTPDVFDKPIPVACANELNLIQESLTPEGRQIFWDETMPAMYADLIEMYGDRQGRERFGLGTNERAWIRTSRQTNGDFKFFNIANRAVAVVDLIAGGAGSRPNGITWNQIVSDAQVIEKTSPGYLQEAIDQRAHSILAELYENATPDAVSNFLSKAIDFSNGAANLTAKRGGTFTVPAELTAKLNETARAHPEALTKIVTKEIADYFPGSDVDKLQSIEKMSPGILQDTMNSLSQRFIKEFRSTQTGLVVITDNFICDSASFIHTIEEINMCADGKIKFEIPVELKAHQHLKGMLEVAHSVTAIRALLPTDSAELTALQREVAIISKENVQRGFFSQEDLAVIEKVVKGPVGNEMRDYVDAVIQSETDAKLTPLPIDAIFTRSNDTSVISETHLRNTKLGVSNNLLSVSQAKMALAAEQATHLRGAKLGVANNLLSLSQAGMMLAGGDGLSNEHKALLYTQAATGAAGAAIDTYSMFRPNTPLSSGFGGFTSVVGMGTSGYGLYHAIRDKNTTGIVFNSANFTASTAGGVAAWAAITGRVALAGRATLVGAAITAPVAVAALYMQGQALAADAKALTIDLNDADNEAIRLSKPRTTSRYRDVGLPIKPEFVEYGNLHIFNSTLKREDQRYTNGNLIDLETLERNPEAINDIARDYANQYSEAITGRDQAIQDMSSFLFSSGVGELISWAERHTTGYDVNQEFRDVINAHTQVMDRALQATGARGELKSNSANGDKYFNGFQMRMEHYLRVLEPLERAGYTQQSTELTHLADMYLDIHRHRTIAQMSEALGSETNPEVKKKIEVLAASGEDEVRAYYIRELIRKNFLTERTKIEAMTHEEQENYFKRNSDFIAKSGLEDRRDLAWVGLTARRNDYITKSIMLTPTAMEAEAQQQIATNAEALQHIRDTNRMLTERVSRLEELTGARLPEPSVSTENGKEITFLQAQQSLLATIIERSEALETMRQQLNTNPDRDLQARLIIGETFLGQLQLSYTDNETRRLSFKLDEGQRISSLMVKENQTLLKTLEALPPLDEAVIQSNPSLQKSKEAHEVALAHYLQSMKELAAAQEALKGLLGDEQQQEELRILRNKARLDYVEAVIAENSYLKYYTHAVKTMGKPIALNMPYDREDYTQPERKMAALPKNQFDALLKEASFAVDPNIGQVSLAPHDDHIHTPQYFGLGRMEKSMRVS